MEELHYIRGAAFRKDFLIVTGHLPSALFFDHLHYMRDLMNLDDDDYRQAMLLDPGTTSSGFSNGACNSTSFIRRPLAKLVLARDTKLTRLFLLTCSYSQLGAYPYYAGHGLGRYRPSLCHRSLERNTQEGRLEVCS